MEGNTYYNKIEEILSDTTTYEKDTKNLAFIIERNLNNFLKKWLQKEYITKIFDALVTVLYQILYHIDF